MQYSCSQSYKTSKNRYCQNISSRTKWLFLALLYHLDFLYRLEDLWLNDNQIPSLDGIDTALAGSREKLTTIYLERNPCVSFSCHIDQKKSQDSHALNLNVFVAYYG